MDCICLRIAVNRRRPPRVGDNIVQRELYHFALVIAQQGLYLGPQQLNWFLQMLLVKDNKGFLTWCRKITRACANMVQKDITRVFANVVKNNEGLYKHGAER
jgi:hypothetical protein